MKKFKALIAAAAITGALAIASPAHAGLSGAHGTCYGNLGTTKGNAWCTQAGTHSLRVKVTCGTASRTNLVDYLGNTVSTVGAISSLTCPSVLPYAWASVGVIY